MKSNQKGFAMLVSVLIVLSLVAVAAGLYFYIAQTIKPKPAPVVQKAGEKPVEIAQPIQDATGTVENQQEKNPSQSEVVDTTGWQTYRNGKCGFEIKYPSGYFPKENDNGVRFATAGLANCDGLADKGDKLFCSEVELSLSPAVYCLSAKDILQGKDFDTYLTERTSINFPVKKIIANGVSGFEIEDQGMAGGYKSVYFLKGDNLVHFVVANEVNEKGTAFLDQIVSSFKFVSEELAQKKEDVIDLKDGKGKASGRIKDIYYKNGNYYVVLT